jgi:hypothetical protein
MTKEAEMLERLRRAYEHAFFLEQQAQNGDVDKTDHADAIAEWKLTAWREMPMLLASPAGRDPATIEALLRRIVASNKEFRSSLPEAWEGDPLDDLCKEAEIALSRPAQS